MSEEFKNAILAGLYDSKYAPKLEGPAPKLLTNQPTETLWSHLQQELLTCDHFVLAPAFLTVDMLVPLKAILARIAKKGVTGTILTADYLNFNTPAVFTELLKLPNVKTKIVTKEAFHMKGYFFWHGSQQTAYVGSANFTRNALLKNCELTLRVTSEEQADLTQQLALLLKHLAEDALTLTTDWIKAYQARYRPPVSTATPKNNKLLPNRMQKEALQQLANLRAQGNTKGLVVSATGTGKTYLGAFDVKAYAPKRFLYIVHREQILEKTKASFQKVIGGPASDFGTYSGKKHEIEAKYLFATVQSLAKDEALEQFLPTEFDYILFDEAHHLGAPIFQKVMAHFTPAFCLGMTATPERMDDFNVYRSFDYNLAYEISLDEALTAELLCPFDYVGVIDYEFEGEMITEKTPLKQLTAPERVTHILKQLEYYGSTKSRGGLVFCSRQQEAKALAKAFTAAGYPSQALTNEDSVIKREEAVARLESGVLKYLISVDIFNEGIDIPCVDQIILLRDTRSKIVFTQQLGRGLRLFPGKTSTLILDFIGNYQNNYLIPQALTNDRSLNKDRLVADLKEQVVYGLSTINFDEIAYQKILAVIARTKLDSLKHLKEAYLELSQKLGRIPMRRDFYRNSQLDPRIFTQGNTLVSYADFLDKLGVSQELSRYATQVIAFLEKELMNGMRKHELLLLQQLLLAEITQEDYRKLLAKAGCYVDDEVLASVNSILSLRFFEVKVGKKLRSETYGAKPLITFEQGKYRLNNAFSMALSQLAFRQHVEDIIETGLLLSKDYQPQKRFTLYQKYTRKDVCRLLDWPKDISAPLYGYRVVDDVCPIFITYQKEKKSYQNTLTANRAIRWYTRSPRSLASKEVTELLAGVKTGTPYVKLPLFIKPSDAFGAEFYYVGEAKIIAKSVHEVELGAKNKPKKAVAMDLLFEQPLSFEIMEKLQGFSADSED